MRIQDELYPFFEVYTPVGNLVNHDFESMMGLTKVLINMEDRKSRQLTLYTYRIKAEA